MNTRKFMAMVTEAVSNRQKLIAAYLEYRQAKEEIDEEPFDFQTWLDIEKSLSSPISKLAD